MCRSLDSGAEGCRFFGRQIVGDREAVAKLIIIDQVDDKYTSVVIADRAVVAEAPQCVVRGFDIDEYLASIVAVDDEVGTTVHILIGGAGPEPIAGMFQDLCGRLLVLGSDD